MSKPIIPLINEDEILNAPAGKLGMIRDDDIDNGKANIEAFTLEYLSPANKIKNDFTGGKTCCFCVSYKCCPDSDKNFQKLYISHPEALSMGAVALHPESNKVIGAVVSTTFGVKCSSDDEVMHKCKKGEVYISWFAVSQGNRGKGAGSKLLKWVEANARARGATKITLGVVAGNPAIRLYERFGFTKQSNDFCSRLIENCFTCICLGSPNGGCGGFTMEKILTADNDISQSQNVK